MNSIDDGDIDDMHAYYNWYDFSLFRFFNGEFQQRFKMPERPLISQEMSTGTRIMKPDIRPVLISCSSEPSIPDRL